MARLQLSDFGSIWKTIREVDISAVRREAEQQVTIAIIGQQAALWHVDRLLREGPNRYPLVAGTAVLPAAGGGAPSTWTT